MAKAKRRSAPKIDLDALIEDATVDAHHEWEQLLGLANVTDRSAR